MNKNTTDSYLKKMKQLPWRLSLLAIGLVIVEVYYLYYFFTQGIFIHYGYSLTTLSQGIYWFIMSVLFLLISISLIIITYGALRRRGWIQKFAAIFILWALLLPLWGILIGNQVFGHLILSDVYLIMVALFLYTPLGAPLPMKSVEITNQPSPQSQTSIPVSTTTQPLVAPRQKRATQKNKPEPAVTSQ